MLPDIRVEQYEIKNQGTFDGAKFLQGEDYRAMYLKVRDELAELQQRTWVDLTPKDFNEIFEFAMTGEAAVHRAIAKFKEKNT